MSGRVNGPRNTLNTLYSKTSSWPLYLSTSYYSCHPASAQRHFDWAERWNKCLQSYKLYQSYFQETIMLSGLNGTWNTGTLYFSLIYRMRMLTEMSTQQNSTKASRDQTGWHPSEYWSPKHIFLRTTSGQHFLLLTGEVFGVTVPFRAITFKFSRCYVLHWNVMAKTSVPFLHLK